MASPKSYTPSPPGIILPVISNDPVIVADPVNGKGEVLILPPPKAKLEPFNMALEDILTSYEFEELEEQGRDEIEEDKRMAKEFNEKM